jgi:hypothetical protein
MAANMFSLTPVTPTLVGNTYTYKANLTAQNVVGSGKIRAVFTPSNLSYAPVVTSSEIPYYGLENDGIIKVNTELEHNNITDGTTGSLVINSGSEGTTLGTSGNIVLEYPR